MGLQKENKPVNNQVGVGYFRELDGLRGIAILGVLLIHSFQMADPESLQGFEGVVRRIVGLGWAGVDLFFVLSGFLITRSLDRRVDGGVYRKLKLFFLRRALRILPAYFVLLTLVFFVIPITLGENIVGNGKPVEFGVAISCFLYLQNLTFFWGGKLQDFGALMHTWSLAVEEHFYIIWGVLGSLLIKKRVLVAGIAICTVILVRFFIGMSSYPLLVSYTFTGCRIDSLFIGALLAMVGGRIKEKWLLIAFGSLALVMIYFYFIFLDSSRPVQPPVVQFGYLLNAVFFAAVVGGVVYSSVFRRFFGWFFGNPVLVYLGTISYGIYLIHLPVRFLLSSMFGESIPSHGIHGGVAWFGLVTFVSVTAAIASWYTVERPCLRLKARFGN